MIDLYLRTDTEQELIDALPFARVLNEGGQYTWNLTSHDFALDVIGDIYYEDGVYDEFGDVITPRTQAVGFHANIRCTQSIADLIPISIRVIPPPSDIRRRWAGQV